MSVIFHLPYNIGHALLPLVAYYIRHWRYLQIAVSLPSFVMLPFVYWALPESPRWYLAVGKTAQAVETIEEAAIQNDLPIGHIKDDITKYSKEMESNSEQNANILDLFKTPNMRKKTIFISYNWFVCGMCYFGMAIFVSRMSGDIFINVAMAALTAVPSAFITMWSINYLGRRLTLIGSNITASLALLAVPFVPESLTWLQTALSSLGILALMVGFYDVYTYGGELYPTVVRNVGIGTSSMCARIGAMIAPFIASLGEINPIIPLIAFGTPPIVGSVMCCFLPETKNCKLPDTVEEGELFGKSETTKGKHTSSEII